MSGTSQNSEYKFNNNLMLFYMDPILQWHLQPIDTDLMSILTWLKLHSIQQI